MKRLTVIIIAALLILPLIFLTACKKDEVPVDENYATRAAAFYGKIQKQNFYFDMELTANGETYNFTQATNVNRSVITTILDYEDDLKDSYTIAEITERSAALHTLNLSEKKYDTTYTTRYQDFLFGDQSPASYNSPVSEGEREFRGNTYYVESYETSTGYDIYYFTGGKLEVIEIVENGTATMTMVFNDYSNDIPSDVYMSKPDGFKGGQMIVDSEIDFNSIGGQWGYGQ